jgi:serine/threonine protein phosphatase PrpC
MPFTLDHKIYEEAICFPSGQRAFFLVPDGHGLHADTIRLAQLVVELLNQQPPEKLRTICPKHFFLPPTTTP